LFLSRDLAHRDHLKTNSYAQHIALNEFYDAIVDLADKLTEAYQGRHGIIDNIPLLKDENPKPIPADMLQNHMEMVEKLRYTAIEKTDTPLQNIVDEIVGQYLSTLYKLRNLR
jgi:hypothetical protein